MSARRASADEASVYAMGSQANVFAKLSRDQRRAHIMKLVSNEMRDERMARKSPKAAMPTVIAPGGLGSFY